MTFTPLQEEKDGDGGGQFGIHLADRETGRPLRGSRSDDELLHPSRRRTGTAKIVAGSRAGEIRPVFGD